MIIANVCDRSCEGSITQGVSDDDVAQIQGQRRALVERVCVRLSWRGKKGFQTGVGDRGQ